MRISDWSSDVCSSDLAWAADSLTREGYRRRLAWFDRLRRQEQGEAYFIFTRQHHTLLGGITLSNIRRGASQCGELGYWTGAPHAGQRYMTEALALMMAHCFGTMRLHRLEAACLDENAPSQRLMRRAGFRPAGAEGVGQGRLHRPPPESHPGRRHHACDYPARRFEMR